MAPLSYFFMAMNNNLFEENRPGTHRDDHSMSIPQIQDQLPVTDKLMNQ